MEGRGRGQEAARDRSRDQAIARVIELDTYAATGATAAKGTQRNKRNKRIKQRMYTNIQEGWVPFHNNRLPGFHVSDARLCLTRLLD